MTTTIILPLLLLLTIETTATVHQVSVFAKAGKYTTTYGTLDPTASAYGVFNASANATGWATLNIKANGEDLSNYFAAGLAEGVLTCNFVAAVAKNNRDIQSRKNPGLNNYTLLTISFTRRMAAAAAPSDDFWKVINEILAQFDGLVEGYNRSPCSATQPLDALDLWYMQMDGDLEDLNSKFSTSHVDVPDKSLAPPRPRPQHCSSLVKVTADRKDIFFGHATWDIYSNAAPRIFKTYTLPVKLGSVTKSHVTSFSSTGPWLSSVDDFYVVSGHANLGVMETSNTVLNTSLYAKVQPKSLLCWLRVIAANRLATSGKDWGQIFSKFHSGTYTNQWQVISLDTFKPGAAKLTDGLLTIVEEIPGLVHVGDQTAFLEKHGYWPSFNVPYYDDVRAANGNFNGSWSNAPRHKLFKMLQGNVTSIQTMQKVMRWNKYQTTPIISGGNPCAAIACRADLRSTGTHPQNDFGAIDAKLSSFQNLMGGVKKSKNQNSLIVFAEAGPTHDDQPAFCWSTSPTTPTPPHVLHPDCFNFEFQKIIPVPFDSLASTGTDANNINTKDTNINTNTNTNTTAPATMAFNLLQYNIFGRPYIVSHDGQQERCDRIPSAILALDKDVDVATFAESDDATERDKMFQQFASVGYRYKTSVVTDYNDKSLLNGGVVIGSKWPILREDQIVYRDACSGSDCLAAKGVKYARIIKTAPVTLANGTTINASKIFNVFATHMQAWYTQADLNDRAKQAQQLKAFVKSQNLDPSEPVLFAGDFNTDWVRYPGEVSQIVDILNASIPTLVGAIKFTSDPSTNVLVGRDGAADKSTFNCQQSYENSWGDVTDKTYTPLINGTNGTRVPATTVFPPTTDNKKPVLPFFSRGDNKAFCSCCPNEWLDFVLWSKEHQLPYHQVPPTLSAIQLKTKVPFRVPWSGAMQPVPEPPVVGSYMNLFDLSDHYPVLGEFTFEVENPTVAPQEKIMGCRTNSDCSFHVSFKASCYCDGAGCTWDNQHVNGWKEGASNPVNNNCHYHPEVLTCVCHKE